MDTDHNHTSQAGLESEQLQILDKSEQAVLDLLSLAQQTCAEISKIPHSNKDILLKLSTQYFNNIHYLQNNLSSIGNIPLKDNCNLVINKMLKRKLELINSKEEADAS